jgi:hypothetical protein
MLEDGPAYITACPVGCTASLVVTDIVLPEGPLLRCAGCGQHYSCGAGKTLKPPDSNWIRYSLA